jgi:Family of unknown function (DUF5670)
MSTPIHAVGKRRICAFHMAGYVFLPSFAGSKNADKKEKNPMLETIAIILIVLWLLGMVSSYTIGGFIHILLVIAIVLILVRLIQGRRPL